MMVEITQVARPQEADVAAMLHRAWGPLVAAHDRHWQPADLDAFVARAGSDLAGVLTYEVGDDELEIVSIGADPPGRGTGRALISAVVERARGLGLARVTVTTTNDNLPAFGLYQAAGFRLVRIWPQGVEAAREVKPAIPATGHRDLPIRDELDLVLTLRDDDEQDPAVERFEVQRTIAAPTADVFAVLTDPRGHVTIDSSGMLQSAEGERVTAAGDRFVVHMDRQALDDYPMGTYDVSVIITQFEQNTLVEWTIEGRIRPPLRHLYGYRLEPCDAGTLVTSYYDWSRIEPQWRERGVFPVIPEAALRATLGILARTVENR